ncbi:uncharacterized protein EAE97_006103 [Botrytis byssoidea]|uniref:Uncharacterized protein n=1 Tax=Botrytis byssoidea TaxID=139641 RepID=A0A9P5IQ15_9HELO|nr:uncharacterized protein EAE97_006103 [Botrytis byssoidea]KAF7942649.1 hypothetical protein EAE97_006103 [Botrytis byssoidea]
MERTTMSCFPEYSFEDPYYDEEEQQGDYNDPTQIDYNPSDHLHCFESCDHSDRYMSFLDFMEPLHEVQLKIDEEYANLTREYVRVNRIYARSLNEFIGSSIKFSAPKRRNWLCTDYLSVAPPDSSDLCVCCDCFQELLASYLELVNDIEFQQKYIEIFEVEYWELVERTIALVWKIDNNQVHADELAATLDAEDRKGKRNRRRRCC